MISKALEIVSVSGLTFLKLVNLDVSNLIITFLGPTRSLLQPLVFCVSTDSIAEDKSAPLNNPSPSVSVLDSVNVILDNSG